MIFNCDITTIGPIDQFPHSMEPYLRQLGLPTCLQKGNLNGISLILLTSPILKAGYLAVLECNHTVLFFDIHIYPLFFITT